MTKTKTATLISADGTELIVSPENGKKFKLKELQRFVNGLIEIVRTKDNRLLVINEEGKLENLPVNEKATKLYIWGDLDPKAWEKGVGDQINGDALLVEPHLLK